MFKLAPIYKQLLEASHHVSDKQDIMNAINDVEALGIQNPFNRSEIIIDDNVQLEVSNFDGALWISSIFTIERGKGDGSRVLQKICDIADKHNVVIRCSPEPFGDTNGLNKSELVKWYKRNGFKSIGWGELERLPKSKI